MFIPPKDVASDYTYLRRAVLQDKGNAVLTKRFEKLCRDIVTEKFENINSEIEKSKENNKIQDSSSQGVINTKAENCITYEDLSNITGKRYFWHRSTSKIPFNEITNLINSRVFNNFTNVQKAKIINSYNNMKIQLTGKVTILDRIRKIFESSKTYKSNADIAQEKAQQIIINLTPVIIKNLEGEIKTLIEKITEIPKTISEILKQKEFCTTLINEIKVELDEMERKRRIKINSMIGETVDYTLFGIMKLRVENVDNELSKRKEELAKLDNQERTLTVGKDEMEQELKSAKEVLESLKGLIPQVPVPGTK